MWDNFFVCQLILLCFSSPNCRFHQNGDLKAGGGIFNYSSYCIRRVESVRDDSDPVFWNQAHVRTTDVFVFKQKFGK
jgi:hypothetical protein